MEAVKETIAGNGNGITVAATGAGETRVCLGIVPVKVRGKGNVATSERQGRMERQENREWRKYQTKPGDILRRHSFNQSRKSFVNLVNCKRIKKWGLMNNCIQLNTWQHNSVNESNNKRN